MFQPCPPPPHPVRLMQNRDQNIEHTLSLSWTDPNPFCFDRKMWNYSKCTLLPNDKTKVELLHLDKVNNYSFMTPTNIPKNLEAKHQKHYTKKNTHLLITKHTFTLITEEILSLFHNTFNLVWLVFKETPTCQQEINRIDMQWTHHCAPAEIVINRTRHTFLKPR